MPIKIPTNLPARQVLENENIFVMDEERATTQDVRALNILLCNLMPTKIVTETQFSRVLGNTPLQVQLDFLAMKSHKSKNTSEDHLYTFYYSFDEIKDRYYDGLIITGAPVEHLKFEEVEYWDELCQVMEWSKSHVHSTLHICWGAQAGLYYHYGINKYPLEQKLSGIYEHYVSHKNSILFRGFDDIFYIPQSRNTTTRKEDILAEPKLKILAEGEQSGVFCVSTDEGKQIFVTGHSEYDPDTLEKEYKRDKEAGINPHVPYNYYPNDDDTKAPVCSWRSSANLFYSNWLNYFVYQTTPYDLNEIAKEGR